MAGAHRGMKGLMCVCVTVVFYESVSVCVLRVGINAK